MPRSGDQVTVLHVVASASFLNFLRGHVRYLKRRGFVLHIVASPEERLEKFGEGEQVPVHGVYIHRGISPVLDLLAVFRLWRILRRVRPQIVHAHTSKGGFVGMLAAWLARVPVRIYHAAGLRLMTTTGAKCWLLTMAMRLTCRIADCVPCVSRSLHREFVARRLCPASKMELPANGSLFGVDGEGEFDPERFGQDTREVVRTRYGIPAGAVVLGFVGRVVRDKGIAELLEAWQQLREEFSASHLLVVGEAETGDQVSSDTAAGLRSDLRVHCTGRVEPDQMPQLYAAMDIVVLPTYREGFPNVLMEAAAMGLPVVATRIPGCVDAVDDGVTGTLVPPRNAEALEAAIRTYLVEPDLRHRHGDAGRRRMLRDFRPELLFEANYQSYLTLLRARGLAAPTMDAQSDSRPPSAAQCGPAKPGSTH